MCQGALVVNMPEDKKKTSPRHQRRIYENDFLREPTKENPVFSDIKTILLILKTTGLLPIYEQVSNYEIGPPSKQHEFYSFFIRGVIHGLTLFHLYNLFTPASSQLFFSYQERDTDNINKSIELILCILTYTITVIICTKNSKNFLKIINEILSVDEEVRRQYGATLNNNCGFSVKFIAGITVCLGYLTALKLFAKSEPITPAAYLLIGYNALQNGLSSLFIVFASALLKIVTIRFEYLNLILTGYGYVQQRKARRHMRRVGDVANMECFPEDSLFTYRMHNKLLRIYKSINECCSLILVGYMGYAFYTITTTTYNLFVQITGQPNEISINVLQWCFAWLCMYTSMLALLSQCCGAATKEANKTSQILARVYGKSKEYQNIVDKFLTKSIKQEVQFTAYGFFVIDTSTLFKIFSAVTTYLVILIQFKQLEDSKTEETTTIAAIPAALAMNNGTLI